MVDRLPKLADDLTKCCGCTACSNSCPKTAITMIKDKDGFVYPSVDPDKCIGCYICEKSCNFRNHSVQNTVISAFVAQSKDDDILATSSSGGMFGEIARYALKRNGVVFGASLSREDGAFVLKHKAVFKEEDLLQLQGSKYLQSDLGNVFQQVKQYLNENTLVLFCGTACQIDGLYGFLKKDYPSLLTVDILCHGVPSAQMFNDYMNYEKKRTNVSDINIRFRDKKQNGWKHGAVFTYTKGSGKKEKKISYMMSPFYMAFMRGQILRENCFSCKYTCDHRPADITIGDYWGIKQAHPSVLKKNGGPIDESKGVSCLIANTKRGLDIIYSLKGRLLLFPTTFEKIAKKNPQLSRPVKKPEDRDMYLSLYEEKGFAAIDELYHKKYGKKILIFSLKNMVPNQLKNMLR